MSEKEIISSLMCYYAGYSYRINNSFVFAWESDFLCVAKSGYIYEVEIKISRSDFFADMKKDKHKLFAGRGKWMDKFGDRGTDFYPNRFFYAVPSGLISPEELPEYAGLISIPFKIVKHAPLMHKNKLDIEKRLCKKFYYKWLDSQHRLKSIGLAIDRYRNSLFGQDIIERINYWN